MTDVLPEPPSIRCPHCGHRSFALRDVHTRACPACHRAHDPRCPQGHPMQRLASFRLDHAAGDSPHDSAILQHLQALGVELGAAVTLWYCPPCDLADALFAYDPRP